MATITELREQRGMVQILSGSETLARVPRAHFDRCPVAVGDDVDVEALFERFPSFRYITIKVESRIHIEISESPKLEGCIFGY